jgi:hypothetical protein
MDFHNSVCSAVSFVPLARGHRHSWRGLGLLFFQNPDLNQCENFPEVQLRVAEVALRDNFCVPWAVLIYMNDFLFSLNKTNLF